MATKIRERPAVFQAVLRHPYPHQAQFIYSEKKRIIIRAGRRGGKTLGAATKGIIAFIKGKRVLYAAPTGEQTDRFWFEVIRALDPMIRAGVYVKNETERYIERPGTENRIKAKTAWNADTLRGDFADLLILDEWQLMNEDAWEVVGAPMLMDNNGDAIFIYTPPSLRASGVSKARDPRHAAKMFAAAKADITGRWEAFHFASHANPCISTDALSDITRDMSRDSYRKEILAEDEDIESSWLVYAPFNEAVCKVNRFPLNPSWPRHVGHDFGAANPAALFFAQDPATGNFFAYHEYLPGPGHSTAQHVEEFKRITAGQNVLQRVGGNRTTEDEIRQGYTAHGWPITAPKNKEVKLQLDRVLAMMGLNKLYVFSDMTHYLDELANCMWVLDIDNKPTNKIDNEAKYHLGACARYLLSNFTPETVSSNRTRTKRSSFAF